MSRGAQLLERDGVPAPGAAVATAEAPRVPEALQQEICRRPVVFIDELATLLGTSRRSIQRQLRAGTFFIPEAPKVDHRHRWSRARVYLAIADTTFETHRRSLLGPRDVRKPGSAAK
jgi:hypothetical protein